MNLFDLAGHVAIVTGGNGGIGLGMAKGLAGAGAKVVITGRNAAKAEGALTELKALGGDAAFIEGDVRDETTCARIISDTVARFGRLDILVNNAGAHAFGSAEKLSLDDWYVDIDTNLTAMFLLCRAAYTELKKAGSGRPHGGRIINVGSLASKGALAYSVNYCASKGGVLQLTQALAVEWGCDGINVNAVLPGWVETDITASTKTVPGLPEMIAGRTPTGRWGQPDDFAGIAVYLASRASDFMNGSAITIDGGYSIKLL
jgi:2-dehydro-3-deoxy-D-gluconate 5-dehydrogenase